MYTHRERERGGRYLVTVTLAKINHPAVVTSYSSYTMYHVEESLAGSKV